MKIFAKVMIAIDLVFIFALSACGTAVDSHHHHAHAPAAPTSVIAAYHYDDAYWYVLNTMYNDQTTTYYYRSATPVTNYSSMNFTRVSSDKPLPEEARQAEDHGERVEQEALTEQQIPADVERDLSQEEAQWNEYAEQQGQLDQQNEATENPAPSEAAPSSDAPASSDSGGSSGGDAGGSDGGGSSD